MNRWLISTVAYAGAARSHEQAGGGSHRQAYIDVAGNDCFAQPDAVGFTIALATIGSPDRADPNRRRSRVGTRVSRLARRRSGAAHAARPASAESRATDPCSGGLPDVRGAIVLTVPRDGAPDQHASDEAVERPFRAQRSLRRPMRSPGSALPAGPSRATRPDPGRTPSGRAALMMRS
jgi:hypothetical protein